MNAKERTLILRAFEKADEIREFDRGRFETVNIGGTTVGRATYQPGWRWSLHVGPNVGATRCEIEHLGYVISGVATASFADGRVVEMKEGQLFYMPPEAHDSWVVGDRPYISLHLLGASHYAR